MHDMTFEKACEVLLNKITSKDYPEDQAEGLALLVFARTLIKTLDRIAMALENAKS